MVNALIIIELLAIIMLFSGLGLLLKGDGAKEQKLMSYFMTGSLVQNVGYVLELLAPTVEAGLTAAKMQYLGSPFIPLFYCWFIFSYCYEKVPDKLLKLLTAIDIGILAMVYSNEWHHLYYRQVGWVINGDGHGCLDIEYGPFYYVFLIGGCILPYVLSAYALIRAIILRKEHAASRKYKLIMVLAFFPTITLLAYVKKLTYGYDFTPAVLGLVLSIVVILVWSRREYNFGSLASGVVLNNMVDGVITLDDEKRLVSYNPAAVGIFPELQYHVTGDNIEDIQDFTGNMSNGEGKREFEWNSRFYECHVKRILDKDGENQGYVILILDVTETKNYIEEIERVREQAEKANTAKSEFLANMSHEIRTPMNAITGLSDIIMEESWGRSVYTYACNIKEASQNLLTIINGILDLSKIEAGRMELVPEDYYVKGIVSEVVNMMGVEASRRGLLMKCAYDMTIPCQYHGDAGRIKQILINLLNNALKFTKAGYVRISVEGAPGDAPDMEQLIFEIADTGCGIKKEDMERIFEDFMQVDSANNRSAEGTGLGLAITKHLVRMMGGTIEVKSVYGEGTTFTVKIPQKIVDKRTLAEQPKVPRKEQEKLEMFLAEGYRVLVVDDNRINRSVAMSLLKNYGFELTEASSGMEAIELVRKKEFDIIFMDHMMPEMDGIEAVRIIRNECKENGRKAIIIALTANAMDGVREKFLENGFEDFLAKPLERKLLHKTLERWIPEERRKPQETKPQNTELLRKHTDFTDIHIKGIETDVVRKNYLDRIADYRELLNLYCIDGKGKRLLLRELLEKGDYKNYEIEVHGLKSASANVGAMELSACARAHEEAAARGDIEYIAVHFSELISLYESQLEYIQEFLSATKDAEVKEEKEVPGIEKEELRQEIGDALEKLEHFHSKECAVQLEKLQKYRLEDAVKEKLEEIKEKLKLYEDDEAEQLLHELLKKLEEE